MSASDGEEGDVVMNFNGSVASERSVEMVSGERSQEMGDAMEHERDSDGDSVGSGSSEGGNGSPGSASGRASPADSVGDGNGRASPADSVGSGNGRADSVGSGNGRASPSNSVSSQAEEDEPRRPQGASPNKGVIPPTPDTPYAVMKERFEKVGGDGAGVAKITSPFMYVMVTRYRRKPMDVQFLKPSELVGLFKNWQYTWTDAKGKAKKSCFVDKWMTDPDMKTYRSIVNRPINKKRSPDDDDDTDCMLNIWPGLKAETLPEADIQEVYREIFNGEASQGDSPSGSSPREFPTLDSGEPDLEAGFTEVLRPIIDHFKEVICNGNEEHAEWMLDWLANICQNPGMPSQVAIIISGDQGAGKDILFEWFRHNIVGQHNSLQTADPANDLFARFTRMLGVFVHVTENLVNTKEFANLFKNLITASTIRHEQKGKPSIELQNLVNLITTTNLVSLEVEPGDRRCVFFKANSCRKGNKQYFVNLATFLGIPGITSIFYQYLVNHRSLDKYINNFQASRPLTEFYVQMQKENIPPPYQFLSAVATKNLNASRDKIETLSGKFYSDYERYCRENRFPPQTSTAFGKVTNNTGGVQKKNSAGKLVVIIKPSDLKDALEKENLFNADAPELD